ncbi:MAG: LamG-like jellyroll fold domain-containing protein [Candidatus Binatia bacterium]
MAHRRFTAGPRSAPGVLAAAAVAVTLLAVPPARGVETACAGDCDRQAQVTVDELVRLIGVALGTGALAACPSGDGNGDGEITIDEILAAVGNALGGCPPEAYRAVHGERYAVVFPSAVVDEAQAAALVAGLDAAEVDGEQALRAKLSDLLRAQSVPLERLAAIVILPPPAADPTRAVVLLLGEAGEEEAALAAVRRPCQTIVLPAGVADAFSPSNGKEPATQSPALNAFVVQGSGHAPTTFDSTAIDRYVGQSFTLPATPCLASARLLLRARPLAANPTPASRNDVVTLGHVSAGGQFAGARWTAYFGSVSPSTLPLLLPQPWAPASYPSPGVAFVFDLATLPGGPSLLPDLDANRALDLLVQDDTSVDYANLLVTLCTCPTPSPTPSATGTRTRTPTRTSTRTQTGTPTIASTPTATDTPLPSASPTVTPTATLPCLTPPADMVAWWTGDQSTADLSGAGNHGAWFSLAQLKAYAPGMVGAAFSLPAQVEFVVASDRPSITLPGNLSLDAWVRTTNAQHPAIVSKAHTGAGYFLFLLQGRLGFAFTENIADYHVAPGPTLSDGLWHHVAVSIDRGSTSGGRLYADGALVLTFDPTVGAGVLPPAPSTLRIGQRFSSGQPFQGAIDEVEVFDRALSAAEVQALFSAGAGGKCKTPLPSRTATPTVTRTSTATPPPTPTPTPRPTHSATVTPRPTQTAPATPTSSATAPATDTPTPRPTHTATATSAGCPGAVCTPTATRTPSGANITIRKNADPDGPQDFSFTASGGLAPSAFLLDDDADPTLANVQLFANVPAGTYVVSEIVPAGWALTGIGCSGGGSFSTGLTSVTITVPAGANVTCTFTNRPRATPTASRTATATATRTRTPPIPID